MANNHFWIKEDSDGKITEIVNHYRSVKNKELLLDRITLYIGGTYIVQPDNKLKLKHRHRLCTIQGFIGNEFSWEGIKAKVKFLDTKRPGRVDIGDLRNIES
ncbi:hypothetical protein DFP93_103155 [Aneurinibacillus soli]|uniref:Uncharacterized protein n=1 Tax=Aneurinibacillus soli TaxID=1500254 RepID=A0A0U5AYZ4_9BACL|nr:hypothetical protein [Aneurinibacillus soli]PYE62944.1 hypothetical protein DFP93_103155 [Aneurinibacillus soli]BAU28997.1 hypothetical protein CB4_03175 [Aneurinibacillus soli]